MNNNSPFSESVILSIGGVDSLNGGGITTDLQVYKYYGFFSSSVISCVVSVEKDGVSIFQIPEQTFAEQIISVSTFAPRLKAIKVGLLTSPTQVDLVQEFIKKMLTINPKLLVLVDPVFALKEDASYRDRQTQIKYVGQIVPLASILTPNLDEWHIIQENSVVFHDLQSRKIPIVVTDANIKDPDFAQDNVIVNYETKAFKAQRIKNKPTAGAGCTFSAALLSMLARGDKTIAAIEKSKKFTRASIENAVILGDDNFGVVNFNA